MAQPANLVCNRSVTDSSLFFNHEYERMHKYEHGI
jgi:hypothetical protein